MSEETILKKDGVKIIKKRLKVLLKPFGFQPYPHSTTRLVRVREDFIDEIMLDTYGYHLNALYRIYLRSAPFAPLTCDRGRLWRTTKEHISKHLRWDCEIPPEGGAYYYHLKHFDAVWRDVSYVLERTILPQMNAMTVDSFLSRLLKRNLSAEDFFLPQDTVSLTTPYFRGVRETAIYGLSLWWLGRYEEGISYLTFAREKYHISVTEHKQDTSHFHLCEIKILALLDELLSLWKQQAEDWEKETQKLLNRVAVDWLEYML